MPRLFSVPQPDRTIFLGIFLSDGQVQSALWQVTDQKIDIITHSEVKTYTDDKSCLVELDKSLQELGPDSENVDEVVFGFESGWITKQGDLIDQKKPLLKKLTEKLGLKPVGFVAVKEALVQHLLLTDNLLSTVCLYFQTDKIQVMLFKQGKILHNFDVGRSKNVIDDLNEGLARLAKLAKESNQYFPAKISLVASALSQKEIKDKQQEILSHSWVDHFPFLQAPTVDVLPTNTLIDAIIERGGTAVARGRGLITGDLSPEIKTTKIEEKSESKDDSKNDNLFGFSSVEPFSKKTDEKISISDDEIAIDQSVDEQQSTQKDEKSESLATAFGVPINDSHLPKKQEKQDSGDAEEDLPSLKKKNTGGLLKKVLPPKKTPDRDLAFSPPKSGSQHKKTIIIGIITGLLALAVIAIGVLMFTYQTTVKVWLKTETVTKEVELVLDPQAETSDPELLILKASLESKELSGQDTFEATGVKLVGEKASGKITLFNKTEAIKKFAQGTTLSNGELQFTLNDEVQIASASVKENVGGDSETKEYGKAEVTVTATEIGADSNLTKDTQLIVADFDDSSYTAAVLEDFTGGASREIRVVSEEDRSDLLAELTQNLTDQAVEQFKEESGDGRYVVPSKAAKQIAVIFDAEVGDEVDRLSLELTIDIQAVVYLSEDLRPLATEVLGSEVPAGFELVDQDPEILSSPAEDSADDEKIILVANLTAKVKPRLNQEELMASVLGKNLNQAISELQSRAEVDRVEVVVSPDLAKWLVKKMPDKQEKISFEFID